MCKAIDKKFCLLSSCLSKKLDFWSLISEFWPFLSGLLYLGYRWWNQAMVLGNFQCRGVLPFRRIIGRTKLAVGADWGYFDSHLPFFLSLSLNID